MSWLPKAEDYPTGRLFCLDLLRGIDMFYLAVVSTVLRAVFTACGAGPGWERFFCSHPWGGFTLYDLIMPLFIFMSGAAIPFALGRRMADGRPGREFHAHVWARFALLWVLGMLAQGDLASLDVHRISPYNNTLQTIAVGYVTAAYVMTIRSWAVRIAIPAALTATYGLVVHFGGDYTMAGNATRPVELAILNALLPADHSHTKALVETGYGYTWFLPSLMFPVIALAGCFSTEILRTKSLTSGCRALALAAFGAGSLAVGWALAWAGVEMVKQIFTVSFTLQAIGWSVLALAALYVLTDILKVRRGTGVLLLFGQHALAAYLCEAVFRAAFQAAGKRVAWGLAESLSPAWGQVVLAAGYGLAVIFFVAVWRKARTNRG